MAEKNKLKTAKTRGKGGSISYLRHKGGLFYFITFVLIFLVSFQPVAFAGRSSAGGGDLEHFDVGRVATNIGIGLGAMAIGSMIQAGVTNLGANQNALGAMGNSFSNSLNFTNMATNYNTFVAASQVGRAVGMAGGYYDWEPSTTFVVSSFATGATGGFLNPGPVLGNSIPNSQLDASGQIIPSFSNSLQGAAVGGLTGLASGATMVSLDRHKIDNYESPGVTAQAWGLVAGVAAGNFGRELFHPTAPDNVLQRKEITEPNFKVLAENAQNWRDCPESTTATDIPLQSRTVFSRVTDATVGGNRDSWQTQPISQIEAQNQFKNATPVPLGDNNLVNLVPDNPKLTGAGLFNATVIKTADLWPQLTARIIAIAVVHNNISEDKGNEWLTSLYNYAIDGAVSPLLSNVADSLALKPGLYIGPNRITNTIAFNNYRNQSLFANVTGAVSDKLTQKVRDFKPQQPGESNDVYTTRLNTLQSEVKTILTDKGFGNVAKSLPELTPGFDAKQFEKDSADAITQAQKRGDISPESAKNQLENLSKLADIKEISNTPEKAWMGVVNTEVRAETRGRINHAATFSDALAATKTTGPALFLNNTMRDVKFGSIEGAITGGTSSLVARATKNDPTRDAVLAYGASLLAGAIHGAVLYATWEPSVQNENLAWMPQFSLPKPQAYDGNDWWDAAVSKSSDQYELKKYSEFGDISALQPNKDTGEYLLRFGEQPKFTTAVMYGVAQANRDFLNRAFSFGAPQAKPKYIDTLTMTDYLGALNNYAAQGSRPQWFSAALENGYIDAASRSVSNHVLGSMAAYKPTADFFSIQRERLVLTNSPANPVTIQSLDYKPWAMSAETRFYLPFPSDAYRVKSTTGKSFVKDK